MNSIVVIGEDELCCSLGARLVAHCLPGWEIPYEINTHGVTKLQSSLPRYRGLAGHQPVLCLADTDGQCAVALRRGWLAGGTPNDRFCLRFAVSEAEAWVLADRTGIAEAFGIGVANVPRAPESLPDAKREVLRLAARSSRRAIKRELVSAFDSSKAGTGYNLHLCAFVREGWQVDRALAHAPSLARAERALKTALGG